MRRNPKEHTQWSLFTPRGADGQIHVHPIALTIRCCTRNSYTPNATSGFHFFRTTIHTGEHCSVLLASHEHSLSLLVKRAPVTCESSRQGTVANSSCYTETIALHKSAKEVMRVSRLQTPWPSSFRKTSLLLWLLFCATRVPDEVSDWLRIQVHWPQLAVRFFATEIRLCFVLEFDDAFPLFLPVWFFQMLFIYTCTQPR